MPDLMMDFADVISDEVDATPSVQEAGTQLNGGGDLSVCQTLIARSQLHEVSAFVSSILDKMIDGGTEQLRPVRLLLEHYENALAHQPPLAHTGTNPLPPNDMMYACFDQFLLLIHQQQRQIQELQMMLAEHL